MLLSVVHQTDLQYSDYINESNIELRMAPRQEQGQHRLSFSLAIGPASQVRSYFDWLGNLVHAFSINAMHNQIQIIATSIIETDTRHMTALKRLNDLWTPTTKYDHTSYDFLQFGGSVVDSELLRELSSAILSDVSGEDNVYLGDLVTAMLRKIDQNFVYEKGITTSTSPITEVLQHRRGVCQDFTHLMIGLARALNIPARYVSGYLHPERQRFRGYTQTHAWVEIFAPSVGWIGVDPTNNCMVSENFIKVAVGRNYHDVPPNKGVYKGNGEEKIKVTVHSEEMASMPSEVDVEKTEALNIPVFAFAGMVGEQQQLKQQEAQQQQEQGDDQQQQQSQQQQ